MTYSRLLMADAIKARLGRAMSHGHEEVRTPQELAE
jgi:hypothetical protein